VSPETFAAALRSRIRARHNGGLPSASELARALNHIDQWRRPVSPETMRRWIRGLSLPELHRVPALCDWLGCSPGDLFASAGGESAPGALVETLQQNAERQTAGAGSCGEPVATDSASPACGLYAQRLCQRIGEALPGMSVAELEALLLLLERRA